MKKNRYRHKAASQTLPKISVLEVRLSLAPDEIKPGLFLFAGKGNTYFLFRMLPVFSLLAPDIPA